MRTKRNWSAFVVIMMLCVMLFCPAVPAKAAETCTSVEQAAAIVREAMENREAELEITYPIARQNLDREEIMALALEIYDNAIEHTGAGTQGDYLYFHESSFRYGYGYSDDGISPSVDCTLTFKFVYYTTAAQEAEVSSKVNSVLASLNLNGKSEYEKVKAIFDYICANVTYDYTNLNNDEYKLKYSAYAALIKGTSVCQGYANLFYRMANAAGLDARIVSGYSRDQGHAWNIVKVDGKYYNIDCTWDAVTKDYSYFLKGSANFDEHTPDGQHPANYASYAISSTDYVPQTPVKPTEAPTEAPTEEPTEAPTQRPTQRPTEAPTEEPTEAPTQRPTQRPTEAPTEEPTEAPTQRPTQRPTEAPTEEPTEAPTQRPTQRPTEAPTEEPTETTTQRPTQRPTEGTTEEPTETPTQRPTQESTTASRPTETSTQKPTKEPTTAARPTEGTTEETEEEPTAEESTEEPTTEAPEEESTTESSEEDSSAEETEADSTTEAAEEESSAEGSEVPTAETPTEGTAASAPSEEPTSGETETNAEEKSSGEEQTTEGLPVDIGNPTGNVTKIIFIAVGVTAVAGTAIGVGAVIRKKRMNKA